MSRLSRLPAEGRRACTALAAATRWSAEEWARSIWELDDAGVMPALGLTNVYEVSQGAGVAPLDAARHLIAAAKAETTKAAQQILDAVPPTLEQVAAGIDLTPFLAEGGTMKVIVVPTVHEKTTVCTASTRDYSGAPHLHACQRLEGHGEHERGREHRCTCGRHW